MLSHPSLRRDPRSRLVPLGWTDDLADTIPDHLDPGRVVRVDRGRAIVTTHIGTIGASVRTDPVVTGDWVGVDVGDPPTIRHRAPRKTAITRSDDEVPQALAANIDVVVVMHGLDLALKLRRMERALVLAWDSGARPVLVLSKADVAPGGPEGTAVALAEGEFRDIAPGVDVVTTSARTGLGMDRLGALLSPGETIVVLGESGVGKSTLINALAGVDIRDTGPTREVDRRGRHTTTARELMVLSSGLIVLDTPGVRTLGLWDAADGIAAAFSDVANEAGRCRFRDCHHDAEPDCGVRRAIERGDLDADRVASYRKLQREVARMERRRQAVERRAAKRSRRSRRAADWRREWE